MKKFLAVSSVILVTACGVSSGDGVMSRGENTGGFMGLTTLDSVEVDGKSAFKGVNDVVIGAFKVGFVDSSVAKRKAGGGLLGSGFGGKASGKVKLVGVSDTVKQQITDAAYSDFLTQLKSNGYNVVNRSAFTSSDEYKGAKKYSFPYKADDSGMFSEYGVSTYYQAKALGSEGLVFMNDIPGVTGGIFGSASAAAAKYAAEGGTPVASATYLVDFAAADGHGNNWTSSASVQIGQSLAITTGNVQITKDHTGSFSAGTAYAKVGQPVQYDKQYGEVSDTTSTGMSVAQGAANALSLLSGGGTNSSKNYEIKANASKYKAGAISILKDANKALVAKGASLR